MSGIACKPLHAVITASIFCLVSFKEVRLGEYILDSAMFYLNMLNYVRLG